MILKKKTYKSFDMISLSFKTTPVYSTFYAFRSLVDAMIPIVSIYITAWFIETALNIVNDGANMSSITVPVLLLSAVMVYNVFISKIIGFLDMKNTHKFRTRIGTEILEKLAKLQYRYMEDRKTLDLIMRIANNPGDKIRDMYISIARLIQLVVSMLGIVITIFTQVWLVGVVFCLVAVPIVYLAVRAGKATYSASRDMSEIDRKTGVLSGMLLNRFESDERTLFGYSDTIGKRFDDGFEYSRRYRMKVDLKYFTKGKIGGIICTLLSIVAAAVMLPFVSRADLTVGMFIALIIALFDLTTRFTSLNKEISGLTQKREYLRDLSQFMNLSDEEGACDLPKPLTSFETIEFREVSFKYPGTDKLILDKISFTIESGYNYSFVGLNGAGKTTVVKLLTGLYSEYEGDILVDGVPLKQMTGAKRKGLSAVVYQDFSKYAITLRDNIALGDVNSMDESVNDDRILEKISSVHFDNALSNLPHGLDTPLGKVISEGIDLSGGEWQRVAMARAMMNPAPLCILDEPTSALDPKSESQLYERFRDISYDRTTLFISHRLGSTKFADTIFVLDGGRVLESGDHSTLMKLNGLYAEMFNSQASWYIDVNKTEGGSIDEA